MIKGVAAKSGDLHIFDDERNVFLSRDEAAIHGFECSPLDHKHEYTSECYC